MLSRFSRIKRNGLALLTAALLSVTGLATPAHAYSPNSNYPTETTFSYTTDADGNATVTGCVDTCPNDLVIPSTIDGNPVTAIGNYAFQAKGLTSISLPNSLLTISSGAFFSNSLGSLLIPDSVTNIGSYAFYGAGLTSVTIGNSVTSVGGSAFGDNSLTSVTVPSSVTTVGSGAFRRNDLTSVSFAGNAPSEADYVFQSNSGLTAVDVNYGSTGWGSTYSGVTVRVSAAPVATAPSSVTVTQAGLVVTGHVTVASGSTVGTVTAKIGTADPVAVSAVDGDYPVLLTRADAGKSVVFSATATATGKTESSATSSTAYTFALAAAPTSVVVSQNNLTVSAAVNLAEGTTSGGVTATVGTADPVTVSLVDGTYSVTLTRDDLGKSVVFSAVGSATGLPDSNPTSNSLTFSAATAPSSVTVSRDGMVLSVQVNKAVGQEIGTVTVQIGDASPVVVEAVEGQYSKTLTRADFNKDITFRATVTESGKAESSVTASSAYNIAIAAAPSSVTVSQTGLTVSADVQVAFGQGIGTVTAQVGSAAPQTVAAVDGAYAVTLTRDDLGKSVVFTATATQSGKEESDSTSSSEFAFAAATAPSSVTVSQSGLNVSAEVTAAEGDSVSVLAAIGEAAPVAVSATNGLYTVTLTRDDLGKNVVFTAVALRTGKAVSDPTSSSAFTFSAAPAPTSVTVTQSGLVVTGRVVVDSSANVGMVTAKVGTADPVLVLGIEGDYSLNLTRADAGKSVVFSATATSSGKAESSATSSDAFTFALAAAPTSVVVSQNNLTVSAAITFAEGTSSGGVTATVGTAAPVTVAPVDGNYSLALTRSDLGKTVVFTAIASATGLPDSDSVASEPFTFSAATAPSSVTISRDGLVLSAQINKALGQEIGTVTVQIGSGNPVAVEAVEGAYFTTLTRADLNKDVIFRATATESGKAESSVTASNVYNIAVAAAPTSVTVSQTGLTVSADIQVAFGQGIGTVTAQVGSAAPQTVTAADGAYALTLTRDDLGKSVVFTATATQSGKEESDSTSSEEFGFAAAVAPSSVSVSQSGLTVNAEVALSSGDTIAVVATVGDAEPVSVSAVNGIYSLTLTRDDLGKSVVFTAVASHPGKANSDPTSSSAFTFSAAAAPSAVTATQNGLTVTAGITVAQGDAVGAVTVVVGEASPVTITPVDNVYSVLLTRADAGKSVVFSATATSSGKADSSPASSEALTFALTAAPTAIVVTQSNLTVSAAVTFVDGTTAGPVTATVGSASPVTISPSDGVYPLTLTRADLGKSVVFTAVANQSALPTSDAFNSEAFTFAAAAAPSAVTATQNGLTVTAGITVAEGDTVNSVTATVGSADPIAVSLVDDAYSIQLTRADAGKAVVFTANAANAGKAVSESTSSAPITFALAATPSNISVSQSDLTVSAAVTFVEGTTSGPVTATVGDADPVTVEAAEGLYTITLSRAQLGKSVTFKAVATQAGLPDSDVLTSDAFTFSAANAPSSVTATQNGLIVTASITISNGAVGTVTATVGDGEAAVVSPVNGIYSIELTRADAGKSVVFAATHTESGKAESDPTASTPLTFGLAASPTSINVTQSNLEVSAAVTFAEGTSAGPVTVTVGDADPVVAQQFNGLYYIDLTRDDLGKTVTFSAVATQAGLPDSDPTVSSPFTFSAAAAPSAVTATQDGLTVTADITVAEGDSIGSVTAVIGDAPAVNVVAVDGKYGVTLTRADAGKTVVFSATARSTGKAESSSTSSEAVTFALAAAPTAVTLTQTNLTVSAAVTFAEGTSAGPVTVKVGDADPVAVDPVDGGYSVSLMRRDLGKAIIFSAVATQTGLPNSDAFTSDALTLAAAAAPSAVTATQNGLIVTAGITVADGDTVNSVTATVGSAAPIEVSPVDDAYSIELTRADAGKTVVFTANAASAGKAVSESTSSDALTFALAATPTGISVTQTDLTVSANVTFAEGTTVGPVTATVGDADPVTVEAADGLYTLTLTRAELGKSVTFRAIATQTGLPDSDALTSDAFTFSAADAPTSVVATQNGLVVSAAITISNGAVGTVTATVGDGEPTVVTPVDDTYSVELTRGDVGKSVVFTATHTQSGKAESDPTASTPLTFGLAASPTLIRMQQVDWQIYADVTLAQGTSAGTVTVTVGDADPVLAAEFMGLYYINLTPEDLGKTVTFSAVATQAGLPDSDPTVSSPFTFSAAAAPSAVTATQDGLTVTADITVAEGDSIGSVTAVIGDAPAVNVVAVDGKYGVTLTRADAGKTVVFSATARSTGKAESSSTSSEAVTFALAAAPTAVTLTQTNLTVSAAVTFAEGTSAGPVTVKVGDADPVAVDPVDGGYSVSLMRRDLGKAIIFSAVATQTGLPNSDAFTSDALTLAAAAAPSAVTATQNGLIVTAGITVADGDTVNSVTATVGSAAPIEVSPVDDAYSIELTRADAGKTVVFTANAASAGKAVSESTSSDALTFALAATPTGISVTQTDLTVSANVTFAEGTTVGPVTATVGDADPVTVEAADGLYTLTLTRAELGKSVTFRAIATQTGLPDSDALTSDAFTFSAADAPTSVVATQNGLVVSAAITISNGAVGTVTATVGDGEPTVVTPVDDTYSVELTRGDVGKSVVFTATHTQSGKAESDPTASTPLTFGLAASPTSINVTQSNLEVSAAVTFAEGTGAGTVTVTVGDADPAVAQQFNGLYYIDLTREDLGKTVTFSAVGTQAGLPDSDPLVSDPFTFAAAAAPSAVVVTQSGLTVSAAITVAEGDMVGTVKAVIGDADPVDATPTGDAYSVELTRADAGKTVVFTATATSFGKADSDAASSEPFTFAIAAAPTAIVVSQSDLTVSAAVTFAEGTTAGAVTASVDGGTPVTVEPADDVYSLLLTRADLGKSVVFSAVATQSGLPDSDVVTSEPFTFASAAAPSAVTATQVGFVVTAGITIAEGDSIGKVTVTVGDGDPTVLEPTDDAYSITLTREDAGKNVTFAATASSAGKAESDATSSTPLTFAIAAKPTAIVVTQTDLTVSAVVTFAEGTTAGAVTATVGDGDPVTLELADDSYNLVLTREDLGKEIVFSAIGVATDIPDSDPLVSDPFAFAAAVAPTSVTVTQTGYVLKANITLPENETVGTVTVQIGDADAAPVEAVDGEYSVTLDAENADKPVIFTATARAEGKAESDAVSSEPFTLAATDAPTSVTASQNGLVITAAYEIGSLQTIGTVTVTVGEAEPAIVEAVNGVYSIEVTREDIGHEVTFSVTAAQEGFLPSAATTSEPMTVQVSGGPTSVTTQQINMDVFARIDAPLGVEIGTVTAVVDGGEPVTIPLVDSQYKLTLTRADFGKPVVFSATGRTEMLPDSDPITSEELTFAATSNPERIFISQTGLRLTVAAFVRCNTDPATYGHLGTATMSVDGSAPETLTTIEGRASKTLTRSQLGKEVIVTGTAVCQDMPESDFITRDPYVFRVAPAPTSIKVTQSNMTVTAKPVVAAGERIRLATVSIDGGTPTVLTKSACGFCVNLTRNDFGKSIVFAFTARLPHWADSEPALSEAYVTAVASPPTSILVAQKGLAMTATIAVPDGQIVGDVTATVGNAAPVSIKARRGQATIELKTSDIGKQVVFSANSMKSGQATSDKVSSDPTLFTTAALPTSVTVSQEGSVLSAAIVVPDGQTIGRVTVSIGGGKPTLVRLTDKGYTKTYSRAAVGKSIVFYVTSIKPGLLNSEALASEPFTFAR